MPAEKTTRQSQRRYIRNHSIRRATRTMLGNARRAIASGDPQAAEPVVRQAISALDRAVTKGVLHKNTASRGKARLAARLNHIQRR